jgi:hypothetical protein
MRLIRCFNSYSVRQVAPHAAYRAHSLLNLSQPKLYCECSCCSNYMDSDHGSDLLGTEVRLCHIIIDSRLTSSRSRLGGRRCRLCGGGGRRCSGTGSCGWISGNVAVGVAILIDRVPELVGWTVELIYGASDATIELSTRVWIDVKSISNTDARQTCWQVQTANYITTVC